MTHEYTLLLEATILPGADREPCEAIAWAGDTILAVGSTREVLAISRGDSHVVRYPGRFVVPVAGMLEVGSRADLRVLEADPRRADPGSPQEVLARVHGGRIEAIARPG